MLKLVACPDSHQVEMVECVETPLGHLIHRCTQFYPTCAMRCARQCASDLDRQIHEPAPAPLQKSEGKWILDRADEDWIP